MFPVTLTLSRTPYNGESESVLGNTSPSYGDAVPFGAIAVAPHTVEEGSTTSTETQVADLDVYAPKTSVSLKDKFTIDSNEYEVVGVQDWTLGFHGWKPGIVVELRRVS
jgi:hypothetical protein